MQVFAKEEMPKALAKALYKSQEMIKKKEYHKAIKSLRDFRKENKKDDSVIYYMMLGNAYHMTGQKRDALNVFVDGHRKYPKDIDLCKNSAILSYKLEDYSLAGKLFGDLYNLSGDGEHLYRSAVAHYLRRDIPSADSVMNRLTKVIRKPEREWMILAVNLKMELKKWRGAESIIEKYLDMFPRDEQFWKLYAQVNLQMEKFKDAASALETAHSIKKPKRESIKNLSEIYSYAGAAVRAAETLAKISKTDKELIHLAEHYVLAGRYDSAVRIIDSLISKEAKPSLYNLKGRYLYSAGKYKEALTVLEKAGDKDGEALMLIAMCAWQLNDIPTVKTAYKKASAIKKYQKVSINGLKVIESLYN